MVPQDGGKRASSLRLPKKSVQFPSLLRNTISSGLDWAIDMPGADVRRNNPNRNLMVLRVKNEKRTVLAKLIGKEAGLRTLVQFGVNWLALIRHKNNLAISTKIHA
jgi:hypothetical protein